MVTRLITAGVGVAIALLVLFLHNTLLLPVAAGIVSVLMLLEYLRANKLLRYHLSSVAALAFAFVLPLIQVGIVARYRSMLYVAAIACIMFDYVRHRKRMQDKTVFAFLAGMFVIPPAMACAVTLNNAHEQHGVAYLVLALGGAWIADSGAYFIGTFFGRAKLCPQISPKKNHRRICRRHYHKYYILYRILCGLLLRHERKRHQHRCELVYSCNGRNGVRTSGYTR